jgi:hypothetical protein
MHQNITYSEKTLKQILGKRFLSLRQSSSEVAGFFDDWGRPTFRASVSFDRFLIENRVLPGWAQCLDIPLSADFRSSGDEHGLPPSLD